MTIEQFKDNDLFRHGLAELLETNEVLKTAIAICDSASPANGGVKSWDQPHLAHIQLGVDRGYNLYPQLLRSLAQPNRKQETVEPTYEQVDLKE